MDDPALLVTGVFVANQHTVRLAYDVADGHVARACGGSVDRQGLYASQVFHLTIVVCEVEGRLP